MMILMQHHVTIEKQAPHVNKISNNHQIPNGISKRTKSLSLDIYTGQLKKKITILVSRIHGKFQDKNEQSRKKKHIT